MRDMADLELAPSEAQQEKWSRTGWGPWFALALAVGGVISYAVSMVLPYYVNDLDRFPLEDVPWGRDYTEMWPYDTAYSLPVGLAGVYAVLCAPFVAGGVVVWAGFQLWSQWRTMTRPAREITLLAAVVSIGTLGWLFTPLASTLVTWWLD